MSIQATIQQHIDQAEEAINRLGETYRKEVIIPLCDKYKMRFSACNGSWSFHSELTEEIIDESATVDMVTGEEYDEFDDNSLYYVKVTDHYSDIAKALDELEVQCIVTEFGTYINDYTPCRIPK